MKLINIFLILIFISLSSCSEKIVELPETLNQDILDVKDVSSVYMFYDEELDTISFNRKNMISSTNWLVAIDKRLTLNQTLPHLMYLQEKRHKDGIHQNKNAKSYFSCSNPEIKNLAFIEFTDVTYHDEPIIEFVTEFFNKETKDTSPLYVNFKSKDSIFIGSPFSLTTTNNVNFLKTLDSLSLNTQMSDELFLSFKNTLTFQEYIDCKSMLLDIETKNLKVSNHEFIYN